MFNNLNNTNTPTSLSLLEQSPFPLCHFEINGRQPFFLIAGTCVIESEQMAMDTAGMLKEITDALNIPFIYKSSYDKANRSSNTSFRGLGIEKGLAILDNVRSKIGVPILTDVHGASEVNEVASVVDVLQTPAFLARQTDLIEAVAQCGKPVNIKKGQFMAPNDMQQVVNKAIHAGGKGKIMVCERGVSFGYNNLVVDMRSLGIMRNTGCPVVFDATHSVQLPGGNQTSSGGQSEFVPLLARSAVAAGISGLFMETHPNPAQALSDGPNAIPLQHMKALLTQLKQIDLLVKQQSELLETRLVETTLVNSVK